VVEYIAYCLINVLAVVDVHVFGNGVGVSGIFVA
jgi:hypothetical protein